MAVRHSRLRSLVPAALLTVATVAVFSKAPAAQADAVDSQFLNALQSHGINFGSPQTAIQAAHQVCDELDSGRAKSDVANEVAGSSNLDGFHAGYFVGVSVAAYCPRHHSTN